ncbi:unnamed protein product [Phytomonas sp. Hart1]|nr:unnamed protein product [Phytomonas sp. Hart1]|eukprot:CCW71450.1 unnamed protein product [Phytomonas sp. isolate Hart1]
MPATGNASHRSLGSAHEKASIPVNTSHRSLASGRNKPSGPGNGSFRSQPSLHAKLPVHGGISQRSLRERASNHENASRGSRTPVEFRRDITTPMSENRSFGVNGAHEQPLEREARLRAIMEEFDLDMSSLLPLNVLQRERVKLIEEVQHHKDEQDSLSLDIEGLEGVVELHNTAARLHRLENFVNASSEYVEMDLPDEIQRFLEDDRRRSDEEVAAYSQELDSRRERILEKAAAAKENTAKLASKHVQHTDPNIDDGNEDAIQHVDGNMGMIPMLSDKLKKFRTLKSKFLAELAREKKDSAMTEKTINIQIKNTELSNARDLRLFRELNSSNASLIANIQMLMNQLNVEHYGMDNIPTATQLVEECNNRMIMLGKTPVNSEDDLPAHELPARTSVQQSARNGGSSVHNTSSLDRQSVPAPLVRAKSQGSRYSEGFEKVVPTPHEKINSQRGSMNMSRLSEKPLESVRSRASAEESRKASLVY